MFSRRKNIRANLICSFCGKTQDQVQRLITGPGSVYICDECIAQIAAFPARMAEPRCSFCGKTENQVLSIHGADSPRHVGICNECVSLCQELIGEQTSGA